MQLPCDTCNGDGFVSHGDRHVENRKEVCANCGGRGVIDAKTGEGPASSASPDGTTLYADSSSVDRVLDAKTLADKRARNEEYGRVAALDIPTVIDGSKISAGFLSEDHHIDAITAPKIKIGASRFMASLTQEDKPTRLTQLFRHDPDNGVYGDCSRTCFAMMLGYSKPEHVPHFSHDGPPEGVFWDRVAAWLGEMGYKIWQTLYPGETGLADIMRTQGMMNPGVYYLLSGRSPRGTQHVVVCLGDAVWQDPHPDGGGIVEPDVDGYYRVEVLVPVRMTEFRRPRGHEDLPATPGPV